MNSEESRKEVIRIMSLPTMQEKFREAMGPIQWNDFLYYPETGNIHTYEAITPEHDNFIRLPLPIDRNNPERGLWGMVDWEKFTQEMADGEGNIDIYKNPFHQIDGIDAPVGSGTPELALLKALMHQWGIEIEVKK